MGVSDGRILGTGLIHGSPGSDRLWNVVISGCAVGAAIPLTTNGRAAAGVWGATSLREVGKSPAGWCKLEAGDTTFGRGRGMVHLVMSDIDGTLVDSTEFDGRIHAEVIHEVLVVVVDRDWSTCPHVTDGGVPEELLRRHGIDDSDGARRAAVKQRFVARVRDYIEDDPHAVREIPGATALLAGLRAMAGCRLVLATSSDAHPRVEIMRIAAHRALGDLAPRRRTYFGDGAWDRKACVELGWDFVAIGGKVAHAVAFASFADWAMILSVLGMHVEHSACPIARDRRP